MKIISSSIVAICAGLILPSLAFAQGAPAPAPPVELDFVKATNFRYGQWRSSIIGGGGYIQNVVPCPSNPKRYYTYVDVAGLSRSDDGGQTWQMLHGHLPPLSGTNCVRSVTVDPRDDKKIIAAIGDRWARRGLFASDDAGETFTKVLDAQYYGNGNGRGGGFLLARDPQNPDAIVTATTKDGVFISRDNGKTWTASGAQDLFPLDIRFDRTNSQRLWLCAGGFKQDQYDLKGGFFRSDDGGATWNKLSDQSPSEIVQDPKDANAIYGIFKSEIIRKSTDGGATWTDFSDGLLVEPSPPGKSKDAISKSGYTALGVGPDFILTCNTRDADFFRLSSGSTKWEKIPRSAPDVGDWYHKGGWAFGGNASSITVDPHDPNHWFMTDFFAIYQTFDGGHNWRLTVDGMETTVAHCTLQDPSDPGVMHIGLADVGNFNSTDGGTRFRQAKVPNDPSVQDADAGGGNMKCMDLCPKLPNRLYGVANRNWFVLWQANQVYVSIDRGQTWTRSPQVGLPNTQSQPCTTIVADVNDPYTVYLTVAGKIGPHDGGVYKSTDGGARWTWMGEGLPTGSWYFPADIWAHGRQLAASGDGSLIALSKQGNMIFRFDPATQKWARAEFNRGGTPWCVVADKLKPGRYFVACRDNGLYRTDDSGVTWMKVYDKSVSFVATDAAVEGRVACGTPGSIIYSADGGNSWKDMSDSLPARQDPIPGFAGNRLFVATGGSGVFWMPLTPDAEQSVLAHPLVKADAPVKGVLPTLQNLNGDAEGDPVPGWQVQTATGAVQLQRDTSLVAQDSKGSLKISTSDAPASGSVYQEWPVSLWNFKVGGMIRARGEFSKINVTLQPFDSQDQPLRSILLREQKANNAWWDGIGKTITLPQEAKKVRLATEFDGKGQIWLDNLRLALPEPLYPQ